MKFRIVNKKKFIRFLLLSSCLIIAIMITFNKTYSKTEIEYREELVLSGDTLWSIADNEVRTNSYYKGQDIRNVIQEIKKINNIGNQKLSEGQKLLIPNI